jgi:flavin reductase (DIM6/NTAB) family NADH-FMN oxidoreductase RutF
MDMKALRSALGRVPNCVCIVSTLDEDGGPVCMTANSIVPVNSSRPRLLWSLGLQSRSRAAFERSRRFGVSVLAEHQQPIARQMASPVADRFAGVVWHAGACTGVPLIAGSLARFECDRVTVREIGDHVTFLGEVVGAEHALALHPLLYVDGRYATLASSPALAGLVA